MISRHGIIRTPRCGCDGRAPRQPAKTARAITAASRARVTVMDIGAKWPARGPQARGRSPFRAVNLHEPLTDAARDSPPVCGLSTGTWASPYILGLTTRLHP